MSKTKSKTKPKSNKPEINPVTAPMGKDVPEQLIGFGGGLQRHMGVKITSATKKKICAELPFAPIILNRNNRANGGALMAYADCLGAAGAVMNLPEGHWTTTLESKTNFFVAGMGPVLKAECKPLHVGRTTMVWETTIRNSSDNSRVAVVTQTQMVIPKRKD